jgi:hypothetical protein
VPRPGFDWEPPKYESGADLWFSQRWILWDITPCSPLKVNRRFGETYRLHLQDRKISRARNQLCLPPAFMLVCYSAYLSTPKMKAICSSETSVDFQRTTRRYIPEDNTLHESRALTLRQSARRVYMNAGNDNHTKPSLARNALDWHKTSEGNPRPSPYDFLPSPLSMGCEKYLCYWMDSDHTGQHF